MYKISKADKLYVYERTIKLLNKDTKNVIRNDRIENCEDLGKEKCSMTLEREIVHDT